MHDASRYTGETAIGPGELVRVSLLAANRDPSVFDDPDRFDLGRPNLRHHLAFARGPTPAWGRTWRGSRRPGTVIARL